MGTPNIILSLMLMLIPGCETDGERRRLQDETELKLAWIVWR